MFAHFRVHSQKDVSFFFSSQVFIECPEMGQRIQVQMQGSALSPVITYTPNTLRFGDCPVVDRRDILMTLTNKTKHATHFEFPIVATFKFNPTKGVIQGMESISVVASFLPPQLGTFKREVKLSIANGLHILDVKCIGESTQSGGKKTLTGL
jgi:hypothetical protein